MTAELIYRLLAIVAVVAMGYGAARIKLLDTGLNPGDATRALSALAFYLLMPAILFRTTARLDFAHMPWSTLAAFFGPAFLQLFVTYGWQKWRHPIPSEPAAPAVRTITATFGNTLQVGIPLITALYGETGLGIHVAIISIHALTILSITTTMAEWDLARAHGGHGMLKTVLNTARQTIIHPVVLPVLAGMAVNLSGVGLHPVFDHTLVTLATGVVPVCLVLIGASLAHYGIQGHVRPALFMTGLKMLVFPGMVLATGHLLLGLKGLTLQVLVIAASLPIGSNPLIFAQRYRTLVGEVTAAIVASTFSVLWVVPLWLAVLAWLLP